MTRQPKNHRGIVLSGLLTGMLILLALAAYLSTNVWPGVGAGAADLARAVLGDRPVAAVENLVLNAEDSLKQIKYALIPMPPAAPWQALPTLTPIPQSSPTATLAENTPLPTLTPLPLPSPTPTPVGWRLVSLPPLGRAAAEGEWTPYLWDAAGQVVAYRTFLQPDPQRSYVLVALVAFDLQATRLHLVLGWEEPASSVYITRPSRIPASDMLPGRILAAFNGGFKAEHGHFGVMLDGVTLIPPRDGFGTVAMFDDGRVALGAWGTDISASPHLLAWRQNGPLIIQNGRINPRTEVTAPQDWGYTTYGSTATGRSALGISADGRALYYAVGFDLTLPALARALLDAGAWQAIQLDINDFYTHFEAITPGHDGKLTAVPLLDRMKGPGDQRYLTINRRDFFYVTTK